MPDMPSQTGTAVPDPPRNPNNDALDAAGGVHRETRHGGSHSAALPAELRPMKMAPCLREPPLSSDSDCDAQVRVRPLGKGITRAERTIALWQLKLKSQGTVAVIQ
jgi:hypothetical protein